MAGQQDEAATRPGKIHKLSLYETGSRFFLVGGDVRDRDFRLLKIDRTAPPGQLTVFEDARVYRKKEINELLQTIDNGNRAVGGLRFHSTAWGILGFIRFTDAYYMLVVTKRQTVALLGGHYVYRVDGTELVPLTTGASSQFQRDRSADEARYLAILATLDLTRSVYFSYSYNVTRTLQHCILRARHRRRQSSPARADRCGEEAHGSNDMFVWNYYLLQPAVRALQNPYDWCHEAIHGFVDQKCIDTFGRHLYLTIIARRSRFFAGARFLKRGVNDQGFVANDVETEQIVAEMTTTSFHAPGSRRFSSSKYTSFVHHRGSIPLYWTQENNSVTPKPNIEFNFIDPFFSAAALHFDDLFQRYGTPIYILNLVKARERVPRESKLLEEYSQAIDYLNQSLPADKKILYKAFDMSRASKTRGQDVVGTLESIAEEIVEHVGFFQNGDSPSAEKSVPNMRLQKGVARTNCIDCLDRTNAAQIMIGKRALALQLQALGVISGDSVAFDTDAVNIFTQMFNNHGGSIATQYAGSHLVNSIETYRKKKHWQTQSRDMVETFKRYYHNSFRDSQRQEAYNLFLGNYVHTQGQPMLWELSTDHFLHFTHPRLQLGKVRRHYIDWYTPSYIEDQEPSSSTELAAWSDEESANVDDYWVEHYRPAVLTSFNKLFAYNIDSTAKLAPGRSAVTGTFDPSPFHSRKALPEPATPPIKRRSRKSFILRDFHSDSWTDTASIPPLASEKATDSETTALSPPLSARMQARQLYGRTVDDDPFLRSRVNQSDMGTTLPLHSRDEDKTLKHQLNLTQLYTKSLNPVISELELADYEDHVRQLSDLPSVTSSRQVREESTALEYMEYLNSMTVDGLRNATSEQNLDIYLTYLDVPENPLAVSKVDCDVKRNKAYRKWLQGKSFFKQSKLDPEHTS